jgi:hypothetical protein
MQVWVPLSRQPLRTRDCVGSKSASCANLFGTLRRSTDRCRDAIVIQAHYGAKQLMALPTDVPLMAVRHLRDRRSSVQSLQHPTHCVASTAAFGYVVNRSVQ